MRSGINYFESGNSTQSHDIVEFPLHYSLFNLESSYILNNPHLYTQQKYLTAWPEDLNYPEWQYDRRSQSPLSTNSCFGRFVALPQTSQIFGNTQVLINQCQEYQEFAEGLDRVLSTGEIDIDDIYYEWYIPYMYEIHSLSTRYRPRSILPFNYDDIPELDNWFRICLKEIYQDDICAFTPTPLSLKCYCDLEATSLLRAGKHACLTAYNIFQAGASKEDKVTKFVENWSIEFVDLCVNFSITKLLFTFLKMLKEFFSLTMLVSKAIELFNHTIAKFKSSLTVSQQPDTEIDLEPTSLLNSAVVTDLLEIKQYADSSPAVASAMASIVVVFASAVVGFSTINSSSQKSVALKLADAFSCIAKGKAGIYAMQTMIGDFTKYIQETIFELTIGTTDDVLTKLILTIDIPDIDNCKKSEFFQYLNYLNNPSNLIIIQQNKVYQERLEFIYKILEKISFKLANEAIELPSVTRDYIKNQMIEISKIRKVIMKRPKIESYRFKPFWINIIGKPQLGKSVFTTRMMEVLYKIFEQKGKYNIPARDNWFYPVNFTEKYLTHYNGQYIVAIDDFLQDSAPLGDRSSAIDVITWVSSMPHYTNQAAIDDKGIPFTSKILITTSNDSNMSPHGIASPDALRLRQAIRCEFIYSKDYPPEPLLGGKKVKIQLQKINGTSIKIFDTVEEFLIYVVQEYDKHWDLEHEIIQGSNISNDVIERIYQESYKEEVLESTSFIPSNIKCFLRLTSKVLVDTKDKKLKVEIWDCSCNYHNDINEKYLELCKLRQDKTIDNFMDVYLENQTTTYMSNMKVTMSWVQDMITQFAQSPIFKVISGMVLGFGAYYLVSKTFTTPSEEEDAEVEPTKAQYNISQPRRSPPKPVLVATSRTEEIEPMLRHNVTTQSYQLIYNSLLQKGNICLLTSKKNNQINTAVRVGGRALLTNHHFFEFMNKGDEFEITIKCLSGINTKQVQKYSPNHCHRIGDSDLVVYKCDNSVPQARNIIKHFIDESILSNYLDAVVVGAYPTPIVMTNIIAKPNVHALGYTVGDTSYDIVKTYETNCPVEQGMSGSVLIGTNNQKCNKIIGIQVCRNRKTGLGYFKPVSQQQLYKAFKELEIEEFEELEEIESTSLIVDNRCPPNLGKNSIIYKGTLKKGTYLKPQTKSKIQPSLVHDASVKTQEPSVLNNTDERLSEDVRFKQDILFKAMEGFDDPIGSVDREVLAIAVSDLQVEYDVELQTNEVKRRPLTEDEMVNGIPQLINRVDMKTSPGWPFVTQRKITTKGGKYEWFEELNEVPEGYGKFYRMKEDLKRGLEQREQRLLNGIKPQTIAYACLKDETRPLSKIKDGNTRAFLCLPLDYNLLIKKYFGAFIAAQHLRAGKITSCVGIDPATQWLDLYNKLMSKNKLWEDFDYKNWDQHLHPEFVYGVASIVNYWYGDSDTSSVGKLRIMLLHDLIFTDIIVKDRLFRKSSGQCSGCAITAELNCIVHDILMYYVWILICRERSIQTDLNHYRDNVASIMYGDDIVKSVTKEYESIFNGDTIKPHMLELGMNITPGDKLSSVFTLKPPQDIYFLKRSFVVDGDYVKAPLRSDIIENIIQWIHKSDDNVTATLNNCRTALRESYMHGDKYFKELQDEINKRIKIYNSSNIIRLSPIIMNYRQLDAEYKQGTYVCVGLNGPKHSDESGW